MNKLEDYVISPLVVVCHDAGTENLIVAWLKDYNIEMRVCMEGPAKITWERNFSDNKLLPINRVMNDSNTLISGAGCGIALDGMQKKTCVSCLRNWISKEEGQFSTVCWHAKAQIPNYCCVSSSGFTAITPLHLSLP